MPDDSKPAIPRAAAATPSSGCVFYDLDVPCLNPVCPVCHPAVEPVANRS